MGVILILILENEMDWVGISEEEPAHLRQGSQSEGHWVKYSLFMRYWEVPVYKCIHEIVRCPRNAIYQIASCHPSLDLAS